MKKLITILLLAAMLTGTMSGCQREQTDSTEPENTRETESESTAAAKPDLIEMRKDIEDGLPATDMNGFCFRMYLWSGDAVDSFTPAELNGDMVNDAVYNRKIGLEERFNTVLRGDNSGEEGSVKHTRALKNLILSGDDTYHLAQMHSMEGPSLSMENGLYNLREVPHVDLTKPWWPEFMVEELSFMGQLYVFNNQLTTNFIDGSIVLFFNRDLLEQYDLENPYDIMEAGAWTYDRMEALIAGTYTDLNGDGVRDDGDRYGYTSRGMYPYEMISSDLSILEKTDTELSVSFQNDRTVSFFEKLLQVYYNNTDVYLSDKAGDLFGAGQSVFALGGLGMIGSTYRDVDIRIGLLPPPKLDETQAEYVVCGGRDLFGIPATVRDVEYVGILTEALSAEGYKNVYPKYYEESLKVKYLRDDTYWEQAQNTLDRIERSLTLNFWYMYGNWIFFNTANDLLGKGSADFLSYWAKKENAAQKQVDDVCAYFAAHTD